MNDLAFVLRAVDLLSSYGVRSWVWGGWGEELRGLTPPRPHDVIDLLYPAPSWRRVDALELDWLPGERAPWRRTFALDNVRVELVLVEREPDGSWVTRFDEGDHLWPSNTFAANGRLPVASASALVDHRAAYARAA